MYWQEQVNISHLHRMYSAGEINVVQLAKGIVGRLKTIKYYSIAEPDFMDVVMEFNSLDAFSEYEDYRVALDYLRDFGDKDNRLWIETETEASKADVIEDGEKAKRTNARMIDDYASEYVDPIDGPIIGPVQFKGPYFAPGVDAIKAIPAASNTSFTSCSTSSSRYNRHKPVRFLSDYEFERRLKAKGIEPRQLAKDFFNYMRDANDDYQSWIMDRYLENGGKAVEPKKAPVARVRSGERRLTR